MFDNDPTTITEWQPVYAPFLGFAGMYVLVSTNYRQLSDLQRAAGGSTLLGTWRGKWGGTEFWRYIEACVAS